MLAVAASRPTTPVPATRVTAPLPDVARAAATYRPGFGSLGVDDAARARELVSRAMVDLAPRIHVNRSVEDSLQFLRSAGPMSTSFDIEKPGDAEWGAYMVQRQAVEDRLGIHGEGAHAGRTVYGSVQLSDRTHPTGAPSHERLNTGSTRYGNVSFVLRPETSRDRATVVANDSFYADAKVGTMQQLPDVVLERVLRHFKVARERSGESSPWKDVPSDTLQRRFDELLDLPDEAAVARLREHLTSDAFASHYVEAQVRTLAHEDVEEIRVDLDPGTTTSFDPSSVARARLDELRAAADRLGIPVRVSSGARSGGGG